MAKKGNAQQNSEWITRYIKYFENSKRFMTKNPSEYLRVLATGKQEKWKCARLISSHVI